MISCTIGGNSVLVANAGFSLVDALENRSILTITILDSPGTANYTRGQPVSFSDSTTGLSYNGFVNTSAPTKLGIASGFVAHVVTTMDKQYLLDKRTNSTNFLNRYAGDIVSDMATVLAPEGVTGPYATHRDTSAANFNQGILSGIVGVSNVGDGDLELTKAGTDLTITENSTAQFAAGTLTNVQAIGNSVTPISLSALKVSAQLPSQLGNSFLALSIWTGNMVIAGGDIFNYDIWITSTSPEQKATVDLWFSDGTKLSTTGIYDQNHIGVTPTTDLKDYVNTWYSRSLSLAGISGKTITTVTVTIGGTSVGTYILYVKNAYLSSQSSNKFLSTTATSLLFQPTILQYSAYLPTSIIATLVSVFQASNAKRVSPTYSIDAPKLLASSLLTYDATSPSGIVISASYDGGVTFVPCTTNAALPALPVGSNVTGLTLTLQQTFSAAGSTDPTIFPILKNVVVSLVSAPNATKSDIIVSYATAAQWNTGTYTQSILSGNSLTLGTTSRDWNDNAVTNQTFFTPAGVTQSAAGGVYTMTTPNVQNTTQIFGQSRLDFLPQLFDFILDIDMSVNSSATSSGFQDSAYACVTYRQTSWQSTVNNTFAYIVQMYPNVLYSGSPILGSIGLGYGSNSTNDAFSLLAVSSQTINIGTFYHIKIVVSGTRHQVYFNNGATPVIDVIDGTYLQTGAFGLRQYNTAYQTSGSAAGVTKWDNLVLSPVATGMWQSSAISLASLATCGLSAISWTEQGTANQALSYIQIQTSIDGGGTFQACTNAGAIPLLTSGTNVSSKTLIVKAILNTVSQTHLPILSSLVWRVLGQYPGSSGTRSTVPLGIDTATRANVGSGFGTGTDGQSYTQVGTATTNLTSNKLQIVNTTGNAFMIYGSRTGGDLECTVRFSLSASGLPAGMVLRYQDANNYYLFSASTTTLTLTKRIAGTSTTLQTAAMALSTSTPYRMRFRVVGSGPVNVFGKVWQDGTLETTSWSITAISA